MTKQNHNGKKIKDKSSISKVDYIFDHIFVSALLAYNIYKLLPLVVSVAHYESSFVRAAICMTVTGLFGSIFSYKYSRHASGIIMDVLIGMGIYTVLTIGKYAPLLTTVLLVMTAMITMLGLIIIIRQKVKRSVNPKRVLIRKINKSVSLMRRNFGVAAALVIVGLPIACAINGTGNIKNYISDNEYTAETDTHLETSSVDKFEVHRVYGDEYRLSNNIDTIKLIRDDETFQTLTYEEKCDVVRAVAYCEGRYLGLEEFSIEFSDEMEDTVLGSFNQKNRTMRINANVLKNPTLPGSDADSVLETILHECRHYYQALMMEMYAASTPEQRNLYAYEGIGVQNWVNSMDDYDPDYDDLQGFEDYYYNPMEIDSREYASQQVEVYHKEIDALLNEDSD